MIARTTDPKTWGPRAGFRHCLALALGLALPVSAQALELTYATSTSPQHPSIKYGAQPFADSLAERTKGEVTYKIFSGGAVGGAQELLGSVRDGIADSAILVDIYTLSDLPLSSILSQLIILADDPRVFAAAMNETQLLKCPACVKERARNNLLGLGFISSGTYHLLCSSPVNSLEDLKGKKVRASSRMGVMLQEMGATSVSITTGEMYEAMQRGQVDCIAGSANWLQAYNLADHVKYIITTPMGAYFGSDIINIATPSWEQLTREQKDIFVDLTPAAVARVVFAYNAENEAFLSGELAPELTRMELGDDFKADLERRREAEYDAVLAEAEARGIEGAADLIAAFREFIAKWRVIMAKVGDDQAAYEQALRDEIYSKLEY